MSSPTSRSEGPLAVLMPGLGAVSTTFVAGVELIRRGLGAPVGSLTQMGTLRTGAAEEPPTPIRELVPLADLDDLVFGAWDIVDEDAAQVADRSGVLAPPTLAPVRPFLSELRPRPGLHDPQAVRRIAANHFMATPHHRERVAILRSDIRDFMRELGASRAVMIHTTSTETHQPTPAAVGSLAALERALDADDPGLNPALLYAYAALQEGIPFANATPNLAADAPALRELALAHGVPVAGKDLKTGQTMLKTVIAPGLRARLLGLDGWFSTNILGNRDGEVLDDPQAFRSKEVTKTGVLDTILEPALHPDLYGELSHKVSIHYYPPRGDAKEGWDNIDLFGWLGMPMQLKVNFLCRDSILAAPLVLDLALLLDLANRLSWSGPQEWLSFYFKSPMVEPGHTVEHDMFVQLRRLERTLLSASASLSRPGGRTHGSDAAVGGR